MHFLFDKLIGLWYYVIKGDDNMLTMNELREYLILCISQNNLKVSKISKESKIKYDILVKFKNNKRGLGYENCCKLHNYLNKI